MGLDTKTFMCMMMVMITKNTIFNNTRTIVSTPPFMLEQMELRMVGKKNLKKKSEEGGGICTSSY
jgi:hypothetical protein